MLTTLVGLSLSEIDTPAVLIDLDPFERNIAAMASDIQARGCNWRPHSKANKTPAIVQKEIAAGAIGVACAKLGEAEVMAAAGIRDILIANEIVGPIKARRLAHLSRHAEVKSAVDCLAHVDELDRAGQEAGVKIRVVIEVNCGMNRAGAEPGEATVALAKEIAGRPGLHFAGLMTWEGQTMAMGEGPDRQAEIVRACQQVVETAEQIRAAGIPVEIVSAGGTGTYLTSAGVAGITEVQAGGGIFGDQIYRDFGARVEPALSLLVTVVSRPTPTRIIVDAGRKSIDPSLRGPLVKGIPTTEPIRLSAEHGTITLDAPCDEPRVGDRLELIVGYGDQCNHLHEQFIGVRNGVVETVWPIAARGKLQ